MTWFASSSVRRRALHAGLLAIAALVAAALVGAAEAAPARTTLPGSAPAWANKHDFGGAADPASSVGFRVYLGWTDPAAVSSLAQAVSNPASASYRQYLTPQQFRHQFAPSQTQVAAVQSWLRGQGFTVGYTPQNNHYVSAEGTVAQATSAFGTSFGMYDVEGLTLRSPSSDVSIPSSLAGIVDGVVGLDDSAQFVHPDNFSPDAPPTPVLTTGTPCSSYWGEKLATGFTNPYGSGTLPYAPCGYTPQQIKAAYGLSATPYDGSGQTVAIIDAFASPTILQDANEWSAKRGLPAFKGSQFSQIVAPGTFNHPERGKRQDPQNWYGEETLDVEAVHGMAPGANVVFVGAPNAFQDLDAALNTVVDRHLASIVTNSYGWTTELLPQGFIKPYEDTILQGVVEGIGIYFSSGDNSDESLVEGYQTADWPASSPWVTAVGGTSLAVGAANNYLFETGWGTTTSTWDATSSAWSPTPPGTWLYGAGGGVSRLFPEPSYQQGVVPNSVFTAQGRTGRAVPDVAMDADPNTGYLVGQTQTFPDGTTEYSEYRLGGTSLSSPLFAGIMALADQAAGAPHGFVNPVLYAHPNAFTDVTSPASTVAVVRTNYTNGLDASGGLTYLLRTMNQTLSLQTTAGYDDVTGLGTPTAAVITLP